MKFQSTCDTKIFLGPRSSYAYVQKIAFHVLNFLNAAALTSLLLILFLTSFSTPISANFLPQNSQFPINSDQKVIVQVRTFLGKTSDFVEFSTSNFDQNLVVKATKRFPFRCNVTSLDCAVAVVQRVDLGVNLVPGVSSVQLIVDKSDVILTEFSVILIAAMLVFVLACCMITGYKLCQKRIDLEFELDYDVRCVKRGKIE